MYKAISDTNEPRMIELRDDRQPYNLSFYRYLQLPEDLDPRIEPLAMSIILITHKLGEMLEIADRIVMMERKRQIPMLAIRTNRSEKIARPPNRSVSRPIGIRASEPGGGRRPSLINRGLIA